MRYFFIYWIWIVVSLPVSFVASKLLHSWFEIPQGAPLARLGAMGEVGDAFIMILPFILASIGTAFAYYKMNNERLNLVDAICLSLAIGITMALFLAMFTIVSGAWFGLVQAKPHTILLVFTVPPLIVAACFWIVFSTALAFFNRRARR